MAFQYVEHRFGKAPAQIDAAAARDYKLVFSPAGKQSMLDGGIGCVRLRPIMVDNKVYRLMSATSSSEAHRGIPIAVAEEHFFKLMESIGVDGVAVCDLQGRLAAIPPELVDLFGDSPGCPRFYLRVEDLLIREDVSPPKNPKVSVAVSFISDYQRRNGIYATYVTFAPGANPSFDNALTWMNDVYVEGGYQGKIITDFDQSRCWFPSAALSLRAVMSGKREELDPDVLGLMHARGLADQLFDVFDREDLVRRIGGRVRTKAFISYSHRDALQLAQLRDQLKAFPDVDLRVWDDRKIIPGTRWQNSIEREIATAKVAVLLISQDFLDSEFIQHKELPKLLEDEERDGLKILALYLENCDLSAVPFLKNVQGINSPDQPLATHAPRKRKSVLKSAVNIINLALTQSGEMHTR